MRYFYKVLAGPVNTPLMVHIMQNQNVLGVGKELPVDAKKMALGILQLTNGTALIGAELHRVEHDHKLLITPTADSRYVAVLSGQVMCLIENECPAFNAGEIWWIEPKAEAIIVNKSGDDAILLNVVVKVD